MGIETGSIITAIISTIVLVFALWIIYKVSNI
jgi:hypothetical protein